MSESQLHVLNFYLQHIRMCMYLQHVVKVFPFMLLEPVPSSPEYLAGLMNISGQSIPVIDLAIRFGLQRNRKYSLDIPILLCSDGKHQVGVIVDKVIELSTIQQNALQMQDEFDKQNSPFLGSIAQDNELALLVNMNQILSINMLWEKSKININRYLNKIAGAK